MSATTPDRPAGAPTTATSAARGGTVRPLRLAMAGLVLTDVVGGLLAVGSGGTPGTRPGGLRPCWPRRCR